MSEAPILVTGAAGFIGFHFAQRLLESGHSVVGLDNMNPYYDPSLKAARRDKLSALPGFRFYELDLAASAQTSELFSRYAFSQVVHLAAQAGVRYSVVNPHAYADSNLTGFLNILEGCRRVGCRHLVFASSSSVYGANTRLPFSVHHPVDHPISFYAATKRANELMAHSYSHLYGLPATGLRFFTVYGPWGRPDMALYIFARAIMEGRPIPLFNHGRMRRDFTYVDDAVEAMERLLDRPPSPRPGTIDDADPAFSTAPWRIYNVGNNRTVEIGKVVSLLEEELGRPAVTDLLPMQPGDVTETWADIDDLVRDVGFSPSTPIEAGVQRFVAWFRDYHRL